MTLSLLLLGGASHAQSDSAAPGERDATGGARAAFEAPDKTEADAVEHDEPAGRSELAPSDQVRDFAELSTSAAVQSAIDASVKRARDDEEERESTYSVAVCAQTERGRWQCDGRIQRTIIAEEDLSDALRYAGCEGGGRIREIQSERMVRGCGFVFVCPDPQQSYNRDIARRWDLGLDYVVRPPLDPVQRCEAAGPVGRIAGVSFNGADPSAAGGALECPIGFAPSADGRSCTMSGEGCEPCRGVMDAGLACGVDARWRNGASSLCRAPRGWRIADQSVPLPTGYTALSRENSFVCYAHGATPACGDSGRSGRDSGDIAWRITIEPTQTE